MRSGLSFHHRRALTLVSIPAAMLLCAPALAQPAMPTSLPDYAAAGLAAPGCSDVAPAPDRPLGLAELVDLALCRAPATRAAWAAVRSAEARTGQTRALYGPRLDASLGPEISWTRRSGGGFPASSDSGASAAARLSLNWLLFDFGGRDARLSAAEASRAAALSSFADQAQAVVLETGLAYNGLIAALANEAATSDNLRFAEVSLKAATARERAGVGIKSDRLQADAAFAQAELLARRAEGDVAVARGRLATAISLPPATPLAVARPAPLGSRQALDQSADALLAAADTARPDLKLRAANVSAAEAGVRVAEAARRPSISLGAGPGFTVQDGGQTLTSSAAGLTLSIPLFDSGGRNLAIAEARSEADRARAIETDARQAAALDVWSRLQIFRTEGANLATARRQLASAEEAAALAQGRYRAGLATITELLNAQASLASARQQQVAAEFGVRSAELQLARAVGAIGEAVE